MPPSTDATLDLLLIGACFGAPGTIRKLDPAWFSGENRTLVEWLKKTPEEQRKATNLLELWLLKRGVERNGGMALEDVIAAAKLTAEFTAAQREAREIAFTLGSTAKHERALIKRLREWAQSKNGDAKP